MARNPRSPRTTRKRPPASPDISPRVILEAIPEVVLVIDRNFRIKDVNRAFERTFDISKHGALGKNCFELSHGLEDKCVPPAHLCPFDQVISTCQPTVALHIHYDASGNKQYVELSAAPILDEHGEIVAMVEVLRDVTHRPTANEALQQSIEDLERICSDLNAYLGR